ncbi:hypothetical protein JM16_000932 [Phytophthora kernoviae]|uniref:Uncharacterized protein n=1 Tax=Phytophthora kernoviae TaxID=325452 RepID=A0A8T0M8Z6_9STRA|nr:hypothetical protein JM16_000932 [Phytophthora kernoviae]
METKIRAQVADEVSESEDDLKYLHKDDVIDLNQRSMRSKVSVGSQATVPKKGKQEGIVGERVAKIDRKTKELILGVVVEFHPPASGKYSRWRADYRDGTSELLTGQKINAAIARAAQMNDNESADNDDDADGDSSLVVRGKRKRTEVDYRQLNELMFAGKGEDSEDDETFEVKNESDDDGNEEEEDGAEEDQDEGSEEERDEEKADGDISDQSSPTTVSATQDNVSQPANAKRSRRERTNVDYLSMHEGILDP